MFDAAPAIVAVFIPIVAVIAVFAVIIVKVIYDGKRKELEHRERLLAMEKGIELPQPPPPAEKRLTYMNLRNWGIVLTALGLILFLGISLEGGVRHGPWGLIPFAIGVGLLISAGLEAKEVRG